MDFDFFVNRLTNTINKNRPADPAPVVFVSDSETPEEVVPNRSPRWQKTTKRMVIFGLVILGIVCLFFLRSMITPLIFSCLLVFYLGPVVNKIRKSLKISHHWAVIIVFGLFLIITVGIVFLSGYSIYGQAGNFFDLLNNSVDNLPNAILDFLGGPDSYAGRLFSRFAGSSENVELSQQLQNLVQGVGGRVLTFIQDFSSRIGWFFFVFGFSFFIVWEMKDKKEPQKLIKIPGYEYDIGMARHHLTLIWRRFLWGQMMLLLIALVVYSLLYSLLGVRYAFILAVAVGLTRMIPYIGSFFAWAAVALVTLFQGTSIFGMQSFPYALLVVVISFLLDKFMDGFIQPKFLAETLKVHPAAVLAAALICGRTMGFLGIFLSAPLVATLKLVFRYIIRKLQDEDPWQGIETVAEPLPVHEYFVNYKEKFQKIYDKLHYHIRNFGSRLIGGKDHGSKRYKL